MSGETERQQSGWTVDTLRANVDERFEAMYRLLDERKDTADEAGKVALVAQKTAMQTALEAAEKAVNVALISAEKAVNKAETAADKRFESMNEFRQQLNDQAATFMPRVEAEIRIVAVSTLLADHVQRSTDDHSAILTSLADMRGNITGTQRMVTIGLSILALLVTVAGLLLTLRP